MIATIEGVSKMSHRFLITETATQFDYVSQSPQIQSVLAVDRRPYDRFFRFCGSSGVHDSRRACFLAVVRA